MNRDDAISLLNRLHTAQNEFYAGGSGAALRQILATDITWIIPGTNSIAGTYQGLAEVLGYFQRRRETSPAARSSWSAATFSPVTEAGSRHSPTAPPR